MLVLKKVLNYLANDVEIRILDTETGKTIDTQSSVVKDKNIFGIFQTGIGTLGLNGKVFIEVDDYIWKLIDYIDSPIELDDVEMTNCRHLINKCWTNGVDVFVFNPISITPLDKNKIFWNCGGLCTTIFYLYSNIFNLPLRFTDDMNVYFVSPTDSKFYKLDMNKKVITYMEKLAVLGRKKC